MGYNGSCRYNKNIKNKSNSNSLRKYEIKTNPKIILFFLVISCFIFFYFKIINNQGINQNKNIENNVSNTIYENNEKKEEEYLAQKQLENKEKIITVDNSEVKENEENEYININKYDTNNLDRYKKYKEKNNDLINEDIVWMVNINLDYNFYENVKVIENDNDTTTLINKHFKLKDDYVPEDLVLVENGQYLKNEVAKAYKEMKKQANIEGYYINLVSGYRSIDTQTYIYNNYLLNDSKKNVDTYSSRPLYSEHHLGLAMDISGSFGSILDFGSTKESKWIDENAYKYGFIVRYKSEYENITGYKAEPWHLRYIGIKHASNMKNMKINTYEEYYSKYLL